MNKIRRDDLTLNDKVLFKLSEANTKLIATGCGFRTDECSDDTYHTPTEILDFEINELYNDDIPDTLKKLYNFNVKNITEIDNFIKKQLRSNYELIWLVSDPLDAIELYSSNHKRYSNLESAIHKSTKEPIPVTKYLLPQKYLIISDIGIDGILIAYPVDTKLRSREIN